MIGRTELDCVVMYDSIEHNKMIPQWRNQRRPLESASTLLEHKIRD